MMDKNFADRIVCYLVFLIAPYGMTFSAYIIQSSLITIFIVLSALYFSVGIFRCKPKIHEIAIVLLLSIPGLFQFVLFVPFLLFGPPPNGFNVTEYWDPFLFINQLFKNN
jgi:hypothetical protein